MTFLRVSLCLGLALLFAGQSQSGAQEATALEQSKGCTACHDIDRMKMAPSFHGIAARYKGQANAAAVLVDKLKTGADGHEKVAASDAELQQLIADVLATP